MKTCPQCNSLVDDGLEKCPSGASSCPMMLGAAISASMPGSSETVALTADQMKELLAQQPSPPPPAAPVASAAPTVFADSLKTAPIPAVDFKQPKPRARKKQTWLARILDRLGRG